MSTNKDQSKGYPYKKKSEHIISIIFLFLAVFFLSIVPGFLKNQEYMVQLIGIELGNKINIDVLTGYLWLIGVLFIAQAIYHILALIIGKITSVIALYDISIGILSLGLIIYMINDSNLFIIINNSLIGLKTILIIVAIFSTIDLLSKVYKYAKYFIWTNVKQSHQLMNGNF